MIYIGTEEITSRYTEAINIDSKCIDITIVNKGTATAYVNNYPLLTNELKTVSCNQGEILLSKYSITFDTVGTQEVYIFRRIYR